MKTSLFILILMVSSSSAAEIEWISAAVSSGVVAEASSYNPRISGDGRFVAFESRDASIPLHRNKFRDVYLFDRNKQTLKKIEPINVERSNSSPVMSDGGRYVAYQSYPMSVLMGIPPMVADIYLYDRYLNKSAIQNFGQGDAVLDGENRDPIFSADGRFLVFTSNATIYPGLKNGVTRQVYLYDHDSRSLELISRSLNDQGFAGDPGNRPSADPRVSRNGRFIAFKSASTNLVRLLPLDSLGTHIYLLNRRKRNLIRVDEINRGFDSDNLTAGRMDMDVNGEVIVFEGRKRNLEKPLEVLTATNLYIFNNSSGTVRLLTSGLFADRSHSPSLSGDGRFLAFVFRGIAKGEKVEGGLIIYDILSDRWVKVVNGSLRNPAFSHDGQFVGFDSDQPEMVPGVKGEVFNVYLVHNPFIE